MLQYHNKDIFIKLKTWFIKSGLREESKLQCLQKQQEQFENVVTEHQRVAYEQVEITAALTTSRKAAQMTSRFRDIEDKTRQDKTRQDKTRQDKTRQDKTRQDKTRQDKTRQDKTRQDKTRQDKTRQDKTRQDKTRQDKTRHVNASIRALNWSTNLDGRGLYNWARRGHNTNFVSRSTAASAVSVVLAHAADLTGQLWLQPGRPFEKTTTKSRHTTASLTSTNTQTRSTSPSFQHIKIGLSKLLTLNR